MYSEHEGFKKGGLVHGCITLGLWSSFFEICQHKVGANQTFSWKVNAVFINQKVWSME